jgi:hypothetical protein
MVNINMPYKSSDRSLAVKILALLLVLLAAPCQRIFARTGDSPGSVLLFPRIISSQDLSSGIAIFNPSGREASVTFILKNAKGEFLTNGMLTIPAYGQLAKNVSELFPKLAILDGSILATSDTSGLIAYYMSYNNALSIIDGSTPSGLSTELLFPIIPKTGEGTSEISIHNPNERPTAAELSLRNFDGNLLGKVVVRIPAKGIFGGDPAKIFSSTTDFSRASHITVFSKPINILSQAQSISGTIAFSGFSSVLTPGGYLDSAVLNAQPLSQLKNAGVIPYFQTGNQYASTLCLANVEAAAVDVTLTALNNNGTIMNTRTVSLPAMGGLRSSTQDLFANQTGEREGWILVNASGRVHASILFGKNNTGSLSTVPVQSLPMMDIIFPQVLHGPGNPMEIAMVNPGSKTANVSVYDVIPSGATVAGIRFSIPPGSRISKSLSQLMPEVSSQSGGFLYIKATEPIFSNASLWIGDGIGVCDFIPQPLSVSYQPAKLSGFAVTGFVTLNNNPTPGLRVVLSGPKDGLATTGADGSYAFTNLPAGHYSMAIDQSGFEIFSTQVNFEITDESIRHDFQCITADDAIVVQPGFLPAGSSDSAVNVFGHNFDNTSRVFAGAVRLDTIFIDSMHLTAIIPEYLLALPARFDITVKTNSIISQGYTFTSYQDKPVLNSITTSGDIIEGNPGTTLILEGSGFLPDLTVKVNGISDGLSIALVDSTKVIADLPASIFAHGGIFPVVVKNTLPSNIESNMQLLTVYYPSPEIQEITPQKTPAKLESGSSSVNIEVFGFNFRRGAIVLFNETPLATRYCETDDYCLATHMYATIPAGLLRESGYAQISVRNPSPSLENSGSRFLTINGLSPTITEAIPGSAAIVASVVKYEMVLVVNGTNFGPQTQVAVFKDGDPIKFEEPAKVLGSTQLFLKFVVEYPAALGTWNVQVRNPPPEGGLSSCQFSLSEKSFDLSPFIISIDPAIVSAGGPGFTLTITGTNFVAGAQAQISTTPLPTTFVNSEQLTVEIPASLIYSAGKFPVIVISPNNAGASNRLFLEVH